MHRYLDLKALSEAHIVFGVVTERIESDREAEVYLLADMSKNGKPRRCPFTSDPRQIMEGGSGRRKQPQPRGIITANAAVKNGGSPTRDFRARRPAFPGCLFTTSDGGLSAISSVVESRSQWP